MPAQPVAQLPGGMTGIADHGKALPAVEQALPRQEGIGLAIAPCPVAALRHRSRDDRAVVGAQSSLARVQPSRCGARLSSLQPILVPTSTSSRA